MTNQVECERISSYSRSGTRTCSMHPASAHSQTSSTSQGPTSSTIRSFTSRKSASVRPACSVLLLMRRERFIVRCGYAGTLRAVWPEPVERVAAALRDAGAEARVEEFQTTAHTADEAAAAIGC